MALTAVITHATGDVFPAADWNTYLRDNLNFLISAGADLASAASIVPTNEYHKVTGTTTIDNLSPAASPLAGQQYRLLFTGAGLTIRNNGGGTGNIRTASGADRFVATNEIVTFTYDGTVWREGQLPSGLYKIWDSVEAGVSLPAASITTPTLPQTFKALIVELVLNSDQAGGSNVRTAFSGDTTNTNYNYSLADFAGAATTYGSGNDRLGLIASVSSVVDSASFRMTIPDYARAKTRKTVHAQGAYYNGTNWATRLISLQGPGAAITSLGFAAAAGNLSANTRITVYGEA